MTQLIAIRIGFPAVRWQLPSAWRRRFPDDKWRFLAPPSGASPVLKPTRVGLSATVLRGSVDSQEKPKTKRKRGRPKGSKTKPAKRVARGG